MNAAEETFLAKAVLLRSGFSPLKLPFRASGDDAFDRYMAAVSDYLKRQILVYQNWPQRRYGTMGYLDEKVFPDMNA